MTIGLARTNTEAHLYMELHPCETCGDSVFQPSSEVIRTPAGTLAARYAGPCPGCATPREFVFDLPEETLFPPATGVRFGAANPSQIIDAGEWLFVAGLILGDVPARPAPGLSAADRAALARDTAVAVAAVEEALKFIPPGAAAPPPAAFWTARGRDVHAAEPGRFRRDRLEAVLTAYREIAAAYTA